eukprot:883053-Rhodomonas_salina.9
MPQQAQVVAIMSVRIVVTDSDGETVTAAMTAVPIFNGAAAQADVSRVVCLVLPSSSTPEASQAVSSSRAPTFHGVVELGPGSYSLSLQYWSPASSFAYRLCDLSAPQHRLIAFSLPEAQIHLTETTDDEGSDAVVLPAAAAKNLARSCGCSTTDACSAEGGAEAALAVDADVSSCTSLGGIAGERGVWMVDLGSSLEMDAVTVQVPADTDVVLLDHGSVHIGMSRTWSDNAACSSLWSSMARQEGAAISVQVNCYGSGQFLFIVAAKDVALSLCDVEVRQAATLIGTGFLLPPQSGSGMSFDGSMFADPCVGGSGIEIGGNGLTLSAWVKVDSSDMLSGTVYLFDISRGDVHNMMLLLQDGVVVYSFVNDECEAAVCAREELSATAAGALAVGQWTHIAVVHEQSDSVTVLFNSMSVASGSLPQPARFQRRSCRVGKGWPAWN